MSASYVIIEVANCHGGSIDYLSALIDQFAEVLDDCGIKFQPFYYDAIATKDYNWYDVYKELYFRRDQWETIIKKASETKDVWLDLFDSYSLDILRDNNSNVYGMKIQASVLENHRLLKELSGIDISGKRLIINVSGFELDVIDKLLSNIQVLLPSPTIILQIGFQGYPSDYVDSGLVKIDVLKARYPSYDICFADHVSGDSDEALCLPVLAVSKGCAFVEKHVMFDAKETRYDHYSSLTLERFEKMLRQIRLFETASKASFLPHAERKYLSDSEQSPFARADLPTGTIPSLAEGFEYKRTGQKGLSTRQIEGLLKKRNIIASTVVAGGTLRRHDFKKAVVGTVIACRMKSSRLPTKAISRIGSLTSVECCIKNALTFDEVNHTILATSWNSEDELLGKYLLSEQVKLFRGDPDDVIARFLSAADMMKLDIIVRVTADCPYISAEITDLLLGEHFRKGADYTRAINAAVGTSAEIINVSALKMIKELSPKTELSEYMTYYFINNPNVFRVQEIALPTELARDYRLTLDYEEDLLLFNKVQDHLDVNGLDSNLMNIYHFLDANPNVVAINRERTLSYKTDPALIAALNEKTRLPSR